MPQRWFSLDVVLRLVFVVCLFSLGVSIEEGRLGNVLGVIVLVFCLASVGKAPNASFALGLVILKTE
jgi:hypothetical protein